METSISSLISKQPLLKKIVWQRTSASIGCLGGGGNCPSEAPHFIYSPRTPYLCELKEDGDIKITESTDFIKYPDPWANQYASKNPVGVYTSCLLYDVPCVGGKCSYPYYETKLGEPRPAFLDQPTMGSSGSTDMEDLPPYSLPPRPKHKMGWGDWLCGKLCEKKVEEIMCGDPVSLTPDQVEREVLRLKMIHKSPRFCHPLVERIGYRTSFAPKDIPSPDGKKSKCYHEAPPPPPPKVPFYKRMFQHEPKYEVVYPDINPRAKVMTFQEVCRSICDSLTSPSRFECSMKDPNFTFTPVAEPYYSSCSQSGWTGSQLSRGSTLLETCTSKTAQIMMQPPLPPQPRTASKSLAPCGKKCTSVSPSFDVKIPSPTPQPVPILSGAQMIQGRPMTAAMTGSVPISAPISVPISASKPVPCPPPPPPPPPKMVCGGKMPLDEMPFPFYSECPEPAKKPESCYEKPKPQQSCIQDRCKKTNFDSDLECPERDDGIPQPFFSECPPKKRKKFEGVDDK